MPSPPSPQQGSPNPIRALVGGLILFNLAVMGLAGWSLTRSHRQYVERAEGTTQNLAQVLEGSLVGSIHQVDLVLQSIQDEAERQDLLPNQRNVEAHIQEQFKRIYLLDTLKVTDAEGRLDSLGGLPPDPKGAVADRPFFQHLRENPQAGLFISKPSRDGIGGAWIITLARRLDKPNGDFLGVVFATLTLEHLTQELAQVDVGAHGSVSLRGADLELLGRYPSLTNHALAIGDNHISGDYLVAVLARRTVSHFTTHSVLDGETRTYTLRRVAYPLFYILVGLAQSEYLAAWRQEVLLSASAVAALILLSLGTVWLARSAWRRQQEAQHLLEQQEAKYRLITENSLDVIWTADAAGRLIYVSPSISTQRGFAPEELLGKVFQDPRLRGKGLLPLLGAFRSAKQGPPGSQPFENERIEVELPCKDGRVILAEIRVRVLWGDDGQIMGFRGVTRDITEQAKLETDRERLIKELTQALAEIKSLSGLLPICGHCKKVRDDQGYWNSIEAYLSQHTEATFTHGVCPDCAQELRREIRARREAGDPEK